MKVVIIPVTAYVQNCSLLGCDTTGRAAVVDPGGDVELILAEVERHGLTLEKILLTHGHLDHVGGTAELVQRLQLPVEGPHIDDQFLIKSIAQQCKMFGFAPVEGFQPDRWLQHQNRVTFGEITLEVIHTPGHTPGHIVFYQRESQIACVGDVIFQGSIGRTDFPRGDHATLLRSIHERLFTLGDEITFIPGHGPTSTFGEERRSNPFVGEGV